MASKRLITILIFSFLLVLMVSFLSKSWKEPNAHQHKYSLCVPHTFSGKYLHWHVCAYIKMQQFADCARVLKSNPSLTI